MAGLYVVHYSEVALKGRNRPEFVRALRRNIAKALSGQDPGVTVWDGRIFVNVRSESDETLGRLSRVFGIAWFASVIAVPHEYERIRDAALSLAASSQAPTFKIDPRRPDKSFEMSSREVAVRLGSEVVAKTGKQVDLYDPGLTIHVDSVRELTLVYAEKVQGLGGLPVGTAGRVVHLFSGGIDSPVAAWLLMKRGCRPVYLHFYLAPSVESIFESKIVNLVKTLSEFGGKSTLVLVPFAEYQLATFGLTEEHEPTLFRRFMRMTAEALAPRFGAAGISTGDALSQAASQTIWNIGAFDEGSSLPILRPLLGYDKEQIVSLARRIGTYESSYKTTRTAARSSLVTQKPGLSPQT
jgi:thiamine biosynthesis protein ThiI